MAKKLTPLTTDELIDAINREGLGANHPYESELDMGTATKEEKRAQIPGTVGTTRSANTGQWMCYTVDEDRKMTKISMHETAEEARGMALERYREFAKLEQPKAEGDTFVYGPVSSAESPYRNEMLDYLAEATARKPISSSYFNSNIPEFGHMGYQSAYQNAKEPYYREHMHFHKPGDITLADGELKDAIGTALENAGIVARDIELSENGPYLGVNYKAENRPEQNNYRPLFEAIHGQMYEAQAVSAGKDLGDALEGLAQEAQGMQQ